MKLIGKMMVLLLALLMLCVPAMAETTMYPDITYHMDYQDSVGQRAVMAIDTGANGNTSVEITWAQSSDEYFTWQYTFNAAVDEADDAFVYSDCVKKQVVGDNEEILYENGTGMLIPTEAGYAWQDDQEDAGKDASFEQVGEITYVSNYADVSSGRATMTMSGDASFESVPMLVKIEWGESAEVTREWTMTMMSQGMDYDENSNFVPLTYADCVSKRVTYAENGEASEEILYENGTGSFKITEYEDGAGYTWQPDNEILPDICRFVPVKVEGPAVAETETEADASTEKVLWGKMMLKDMAGKLSSMTAQEIEQMALLVDQAMNPKILCIESVGTMDDVEPMLYCIDAYKCTVENYGEEGIQLSYDNEADWARFVLDTNMAAVVPENTEDPENSKTIVLSGAEEFANWWTNNCSTMTEDTPTMFYLYMVDADENILMLIFQFAV